MIKRVEKYLAIIPARGGSTRIPNKNIKIFNGKPLIYYPIIQALESKLFDRVIVDTDSEEIARVAKRYGAEVPFLRPAEFATSTAKIGDAVDLLLKRLKEEQNYKPDVLSFLYTTSPLREMEDIQACFDAMQNPKINSVATICETNPWFFHLHPHTKSHHKIVLVNKEAAKTTNTQGVDKGYILNGCMVFMIKVPYFNKIKQIVDFHGGTVGIVAPRWRSVDLDHPEDWVLAELIHRNKDKINAKLKEF